MKTTTRQLKKIIINILSEGQRVIVDPEGEAQLADKAFLSVQEKDAMSQGIPQLDRLRASGNPEDVVAARDLATTLGLQPELTSSEETALKMGREKAMQIDEPVSTDASDEEVLDFYNERFIKELPKRIRTTTKNFNAIKRSLISADATGEFGISSDPASSLDFLEHFIDEVGMNQDGTINRYPYQTSWNYDEKFEEVFEEKLSWVEEFDFYEDKYELTDKFFKEADIIISYLVTNYDLNIFSGDAESIAKRVLRVYQEIFGAKEVRGLFLDIAKRYRLPLYDGPLWSMQTDADMYI